MNTRLFAFRPPAHAFAIVDRPKVIPERFEPSDDDIRSYAYPLSQQAGAEQTSAQDHWFSSCSLLRSLPADTRTDTLRPDRPAPNRDRVLFELAREAADARPVVLAQTPPLASP